MDRDRGRKRRDWRQLAAGTPNVAIRDNAGRVCEGALGGPLSRYEREAGAEEYARAPKLGPAALPGGLPVEAAPERALVTASAPGATLAPPAGTAAPRPRGGSAVRFIPTYVHGIIDYVSAAALAAAPNLFGFARLGGAPVRILRGLSAFAVLYSALTDYEWGIVKALSMRTHLRIDAGFGLFLLAAPRVFRLAGLGASVRRTYAGFGLFALAASLLTKTEVPARPALPGR